jgi:hypothetical protein
MALLQRGFATPTGRDDRVDERTARTIPYDHSFQFHLDGSPQKTHRRTVTVSVESSFTAVSIGYGVVPEVSPVVFGIDAQKVFGDLRSATLRNLDFASLMDSLSDAVGASPDVRGNAPPLELALRNGIKLNPSFATLALQGEGKARIDPTAFSQLFQVAGPPPEDVQFLYALFDEGSGREFQSTPLLSIAGLGAADGKRPFRYFAQPIQFAPLATIRMEVTELSDFRGELHVALHGYKLLGETQPAGSSRDHSRRRRR